MIGGRERLFMAAALAAMAAAVPERVAARSDDPDDAALWSGETERLIDVRRQFAGKPWKRGGRHTIKQRRALAFAAGRRS